MKNQKRHTLTEQKRWRLPELLKKSGIVLKESCPDIVISHVTDDSRDVRPETLFVAVKGTRADGHRFIHQAIQRGARAILVEENGSLPSSVAVLHCESTSLALGPVLHTFYGTPSRKLRVIGVTGTNGKTTVTWLIRHLLESIHIPCGVIGTVKHFIGAQERPSGNTTPGVRELQSLLSEMVTEGLSACALEVSSHALDQHRTDGIEWAAGVFTNITPEHLDYHVTFENYFRTKLSLFQKLSLNAIAIINREDPVWENVRSAARGQVLTFGFREGADVAARNIRLGLYETSCMMTSPEGSFPVRWKLIGRHNIENLLAAVSVLVGLKIPLKKALAGVSTFSGVPGRLEQVDAGQSFPVFVDYAHTDGALQKVLEQLRAVTDRRIAVVFGGGGDRDRTKRPRMGKVAVSYADRVIVTSDNPRSEEPQAIADEITAGMQGHSTPWRVILDRREAIDLALNSADDKWMVLIAGKGHETGQIFKDRTVPFDDRAVARGILSRQNA